MSDVHAEVGDTLPSHPIATLRPALEVSGLLLVLGAAICEAGFVVLALDTTDGAGDFFASVGLFQLWVLPVAILGLLITIAPRLFFRWQESVPAGIVNVSSGIGLAVILVGLVCAGGGTAVAISRASDEIYDVGAGEWLANLGVGVVGLAGLLIVATAVTAARRAAPRPVVEPLD